jgi:hypothetical protein
MLRVQHNVATRYVPPVTAKRGRDGSGGGADPWVVWRARYPLRGREHTWTKCAKRWPERARRLSPQNRPAINVNRTKDQATTPDSVGTSDVQKAQRVALTGMLLRQNGQSRVVGSTGNSVLRRDIR